MDGCEAAQGIARDLKKGRETLHSAITKFVREDAREGKAVDESVAHAGRRLRAIGQDPPLSVRAPGEIYRMQKDADVARRLYAATRAQEGGIGKSQRGRQVILTQQTLAIVKVGQDQAEQMRALNEACLDALPFLGRDQEGQGIELPGALETLGITIDIVGDAVLKEKPLRRFGSRLQFTASQAPEGVNQWKPMRACAVRWRNHFVVNRARWRIIGEKTGGERIRRQTRGGGWFWTGHLKAQNCKSASIWQSAETGHRVGSEIIAESSETIPWASLKKRRGQECRFYVLRRSNVNGKSSLGGAFFGWTGPGVWPMRKKRARRRLSAS
jgi:hypothetical protein